MSSYNIENVLNKVGSFGIYQKLLLLAGGVSIVPFAMPNYIMYFAAQEPSWKCVANSSVCLHNGTLPSDHIGRCLLPRDQWEYVGAEELSVVSRYDLVCDSKWWIPLTSTLFFLGYAIGSISLGWLADKIGRKKVVYVSSGCALSIGLCIAFSPNIYVFCIFRMLTGIFKGGITTNFMVLVCEFLDNKHRPFSVLFIWGFNVLGSVVLALTAYFVREWKYLFIWTTAPYFLLFCFYPVVPESVRWLLLHGKNVEAKAIFDKISKWNGTKQISDKEMLLCSSGSKDEEVGEEIKAQSEIIEVKTKKESNFCGIISTLFLFKITSYQSMAWFIVGVLYFGLSLGADDLGGSMYLNFILIAITEIPAQLIGSFLSHRCGRKWTVILPLFLSGVMCFLLILSIEKSIMLSVALASFGKFFVSISSSGQCNWATELYPTTMRSEGLGFAFFMLTVGGMAAPWVFKVMREVTSNLPYIFMGTFCIIVACLQLNLPETKGRTTAERLSSLTNVVAVGDDDKNEESDLV